MKFLHLCFLLSTISNYVSTVMLLAFGTPLVMVKTTTFKLGLVINENWINLFMADVIVKARCSAVSRANWPSASAALLHPPHREQRARYLKDAW